MHPVEEATGVVGMHPALPLSVFPPPPFVVSVLRFSFLPSFLAICLFCVFNLPSPLLFWEEGCVSVWLGGGFCVVLHD